MRCEAQQVEALGVRVKERGGREGGGGGGGGGGESSSSISATMGLSPLPGRHAVCLHVCYHNYAPMSQALFCGSKQKGQISGPEISSMFGVCPKDEEGTGLCWRKRWWGRHRAG